MFKLTADNLRSNFLNPSILHTIGFDNLKLDRSLITPAGFSQRSRRDLLTLLPKLSSLAPLTACGVETTYLATLCKDLGFSYVQGYLYGKPEPLTNLTQERLAPHYLQKRRSNLV